MGANKGNHLLNQNWKNTYYILILFSCVMSFSLETGQYSNPDDTDFLRPDFKK